jgi:hypothetical protein
MYMVIRSYSGQGASELFDALAERSEDVKAIISTVPGSPATKRSAATAVDRP